MQQEKYAALREMESFTQDMFNRIIDFQEKQHPAWNPELSFDERINGLPLHYLIFSCADRDPKQFGPTVAHYYPLHEEMQTIAWYCKQVSSNPRLCDLYPGNGFIGSLIAREGVHTIGIQNDAALPNQISRFYDKTVYEFSDAALADTECDAVFISWPPSGVNPLPDVANKRPKLIITVYTDHINPETHQRQTGTDDMFDSLPAHYQLIGHWSVTRPKDLLHEIWPDMTPNIEEIRQVRIYADEPYHTITPPTDLPSCTPYDWEQDLHMAELALDAKREMEMRGFRT
jgi:hypothetical protein